MSATSTLVRGLVARGEVQPSMHAYQEFVARDIFFDELVAGIGEAVLIEDYPDAFKGPAVLVLQTDSAGQAALVVWGIPRGKRSPAVIVTAYRPDRTQWSADFTKRSKS